jgi:uncharacterized protein YndB with AHSA1/START domain
MTNVLKMNVPVDTLAMDFTREFAAPRNALFRAHADPDLVKRWLGPARNEMTVERWDFRTGGGYRYLHRGPDGGEYWFNGVFHRVREDELIIQTFEFEGAPDMVNIEYVSFEHLGDGRSLLRGRSICPNIQARDALLDSGMEGGMTEGYERLESLLVGV